MKKHQKRVNHRVNYQNQFLYCSLEGSDSHFANGAHKDVDGTLRNTHWTEPGGNLVKQLHRIQSIDYGLKTNILDLNQFGSAGRYDTAVSTSPEVSINFEYYLADGFNEQNLGFITDGKIPTLSRFLEAENYRGSNLFLAIGPDGHDIILSDLAQKEHLMSVIGVGNAYLNQYAVTAEVGKVPRARMSFDALNIRSYKGQIQNLPVPSIDSRNVCKSMYPDYHFSIPDTYQSFVYPKINGLESFDFQENSKGVSSNGIRIFLDDGALITKQRGAFDDPLCNIDGAAHLQGFSINASLPNTRLHRIGELLEVSRQVDFPAKVEVRFTAIVSELKQSNLYYELCHNKTHNIVIAIDDHCSVESHHGQLSQSTSQIVFYFKKAQLDTEAFQSAVEGTASKIVELSFTTPIADPMICDEGFFMFGKSFFPEAPKIVAWGHPL